MALDLFGIDNENDFYPTAFLSSALEGEISDAIARWASGDEAKTPDKRLESIAEDYLRLLSRIRQSGTRDIALETAKAAYSLIVPALGYPYGRSFAELEDGTQIPLLARVADADGRDRLWIIEAPLPGKEDEASDPISLPFSREQFPESLLDAADTSTPIEDLISNGIFDRDDPPRFVIVASPTQLVLIDRNKWTARSVLRFDLSEIFSRADAPTLQAMACFIACEARVPKTGIALAERLEEEAQRHANAVTASLKKTVREAIEILGNEVLAVCENKYPKGHPRAGVWIESEALSIECLRYMYRLLFLFYAEANPRLGIMPMKDPAYLSGYSLEALRGLESVRLRTLEDQTGTFIWDSLQRLLGLMFEGLEPKSIGASRSFSLPRVRVSLLDPKSTPILSRVRLRNAALQRIIRLLSLKQDKAGTGRISYAQLGIGQLGAVYETLISFTGFVAKSDLIELIPKKGKDNDDNEDDPSEDDGDVIEDEEEAYSAVDKIDPLAPSYFVERSRADEFTPEQIVYDGTEPRIYKRGSFVYRLAGRDRQKSASYYTPEPLARLLVKHALMELCKDLLADDILELKILEPAMGSAAFLVEATNQLADLYLERKQEETAKRIPQEDYFSERQKVRAYIADRNCFGVDLNPIAVELGQISLWLNSLHKGDFSPWFGDQLHAGNSLIGARRASYSKHLLSGKKAKDLWLGAKPQEIGWRGELPDGHVWQFLLPAEKMANFDSERSIREFAGEAQDAIKAWRRGGFFAPFEAHEVKLLVQLSEAADALFDAVADDLEKMRTSSNDAITLWPEKSMAGVKGLDYQSKLERLRVLQGEEHVANSLPYQRLKTAMDAWCALWLWPLDQAEKLPSRREWLRDLSLILLGGMTSDGEVTLPEGVELQEAPQDLVEMMEARQAAAEEIAADMPSKTINAALFQATDIDTLIRNSPWLQVARETARRERFVHYDLIFADIQRARGGFDLIVGNPPWAKPSWNEGLVLADIDPKHMNLSASDAKKILAEALAQAKGEARFLEEFVSTRGAMAVTSSEMMHPFAGGGSNNLYRCFVDLAFRLTAPKGYAAMIHQDGHLGDPKSGDFRRHWYARIAKHFDHSNKITSKNFSEVVDHVRFSLNIYRGMPTEISFDQFTMAFLASQVEETYQHDGSGPIPAIKDADGYWDTRGHRERLIRIDRGALSVIHALSEAEGTPVEEARFIQPFSARMLDVFSKIAHFPKFGAASREQGTVERGARQALSVPSGWQMSSCWNETTDQNRGLIVRRTEFRVLDETIYQGPMFFVATPTYKCPRTSCRTSADYDVVDLSNATQKIEIRSNYGPGQDSALYRAALPASTWNPTRKHYDHYRLAFRKRINLNSERSLVAAVLPPKLAHLFTVESCAFELEGDLVAFSPFFFSLLSDFLIKASNKADFQASALEYMPVVVPNQTAQHRSLRLNCLTSEYADLWNHYTPSLPPLPWSSDDPRLALEGLVEGPAQWDRTAALRTEFARRMALVEIDVLVAQAFGLTLDQLIEIYRIYFPVLQENEAGTWYDQNGRIVWTCSKGLPGVGWLEPNRAGVMKSPGRAAWERKLEEMSALPVEKQVLTCTVEDDTQPGGPRKIERRFVGPFTKCDRVEDYKRAWAFFEAHKDKDGMA